MDVKEQGALNAFRKFSRNYSGYIRRAGIEKTYIRNVAIMFSVNAEYCKGLAVKQNIKYCGLFVYRCLCKFFLPELVNGVKCKKTKEEPTSYVELCSVPQVKEDNAFDLEIIKTLKRLDFALTDREKQVITAYLNGFDSLQEIARFCGCSFKTVQKNFDKAVKKITLVLRRRYPSMISGDPFSVLAHFQTRKPKDDSKRIEAIFKKVGNKPFFMREVFSRKAEVERRIFKNLCRQGFFIKVKKISSNGIPRLAWVRIK